jgi:hypothetical protein
MFFRSNRDLGVMKFAKLFKMSSLLINYLNFHLNDLQDFQFTVMIDIVSKVFVFLNNKMDNPLGNEFHPRRMCCHRDTPSPELLWSFECDTRTQERAS